MFFYYYKYIYSLLLFVLIYVYVNWFFYLESVSDILDCLIIVFLFCGCGGDEW